MVRSVALGLVAGGLILLAPHRALAAESNQVNSPGFQLEQSAAAATRATQGAAPVVIYAVDNPAQPGDAFPTGPFSGGTD
jgi:hypothetical protein